MKLRFGFVSNSSSSSFIVRMPEKTDEKAWKKGMYKSSELMTEADVEKVLKYGFFPTEHNSPSSLEHENWTMESTSEVTPELISVLAREVKREDLTSETEQLGYCVSCNEDEVISFLVENNIPFNGVRHYGHCSVFFQRGSKTILWMDNLGVAFEMYGHGNGAMSDFLLERSFKTKPVRRESIKNYIRRQK